MTNGEILRAAAAALRMDSRRAERGHELTRALAALTGTRRRPPSIGAHVARWLTEAADLCDSIADLPDAMGRVEAVAALHAAGGNPMQRATWDWVAHTIQTAVDGPSPGK
jgi:hypothetical protein